MNAARKFDAVEKPRRGATSSKSDSVRDDAAKMNRIRDGDAIFGEVQRNPSYGALADLIVAAVYEDALEVTRVECSVLGFVTGFGYLQCIVNPEGEPFALRHEGREGHEDDDVKLVGVGGDHERLDADHDGGLPIAVARALAQPPLAATAEEPRDEAVPGPEAPAHQLAVLARRDGNAPGIGREVGVVGLLLSRVRHVGANGPAGRVALSTGKRS
ncbi:MAG: hypothetical protein AAF447_21120 [Myxococcota bacterium]